MVDATPTPEYGDEEYQRGFKERLRQLEEEAKISRYQNNGLMIWNISGYGVTTYPSRSFFDTIFGRNKEFKHIDESSMQYLTRMSKSGFPSRDGDNLNLVHKKISLEFRIADLVSEKLEDDEGPSFTILTLICLGWRKASATPEGRVYSRPDILHFPESLIRWEDIARDSYRKNRRKKR